MIQQQALFHPVQIGNVVIPGNLFLAPLAGYTDRAFRTICKSMGASFTYSEMVSAEGVARESQNTDLLMIRGDNEELFSIQIFMIDASVVERCLPRLLTFNPTVIDLNCGCPVPKVVKTGAGSALLKTPRKIHDIVQVIKSGCNIPVSVKIRTGWDAHSINYRETADAALSAGADMITMHARTKAMGYSGTADWQALSDLKQFVLSRTLSQNKNIIPVFGSGDLFSALAAKQMLEQTKVDGVMFARGAIGNPFIFQETQELLTNAKLPDSPSILERVTVMKKQLALLSIDKGERLACKEMRKHAAAYLKGIPHAAQAKQELVKSETITDYEIAFAALLQHNSLEAHL
jgi:tRNA-dihydrouridine synthase B